MAFGIVDLGSQLSGLGDTLLQNRELNRQQQMRDAIGAARLPDGSIDYDKAAQIALSFGSPQTASALAGLQNQKVMQGFKEREVSLAESNALEKPTPVWKKDPDTDEEVPYLQIPVIGPDGKRTYRIERMNITQSGGAPVPPSSPRNPYASPGKVTDDQAKNAGFATRMLDAEAVFQDPEVLKAAGNTREQMLGELGERVPFGLARGYGSPQYQRFDQAARNFINAVLRRESGAVISPDEFANARLQYLPQPGDSPERLVQKAQNRRTTLEGIAGGAGRGYLPPRIFDQQGNVVENPRFRQQPQGPMQGGPAPQGAPQVSGPIQLTPQHIAALRANPQRAQEFDAKFGPGTAAAILGQQ